MKIKLVIEREITNGTTMYYLYLTCYIFGHIHTKKIKFDLKSNKDIKLSRL